MSVQTETKSCQQKALTDDFRYPVEEFEVKSEGDTWAVRIGGSEFRADGFKLSLDNDNQARIKITQY